MPFVVHTTAILDANTVAPPEKGDYGGFIYAAMSTIMAGMFVSTLVVKPAALLV
jgi:hypothetical protein